MPILREETATGFEEYKNSLKKLRKEGYSDIFAFFCGALKPTGESWCGDCTRALPVLDSSLHQLREKLEEAPDQVKAAYLFVSIESNDWRGHSKFKTDPYTRLTHLPTLIVWNRETEKGRLNENECAVLDKMYAMLKV